VSLFSSRRRAKGSAAAPHTPRHSASVISLLIQRPIGGRTEVWENPEFQPRGFLTRGLDLHAPLTLCS